MTGTADAMQTDFETLRPPASPNWWLVAPQDLTPASPHAVPPVFPVPAEALRDAWLRMLAAQPRARVLGRSADGLQVEACQRTPVLRFTDLVSARFLPLGPEASTLAVYSRSQLGYWDVGVNARRVRLWLRALRKELPGAARD
jgi:uncharacterized protein (DUF1499 family)